MTPISGNNKFSRGINALSGELARLRPGSVPDVLIDVTTKGTFIRPLGTRNRSTPSTKREPPRWG